MQYVMSDLHGDYDKYVQMLQKIQLTEQDTLYVLGDVLDRGSQGVKILLDMMMRPNIVPILGNHEYMTAQCMPWLFQEVTEDSIDDVDEAFLQGLTEWMSVGGEATIVELHQLDEEEREMVAEYLEEFELYRVVKADGKTFVLVHAGLANFTPERNLDDYDLSELLFQKPDYSRVYFSDKHLVTGHTPTRAICVEQNHLTMEERNQSEYQDRIIQQNNHIAIDCGCGYGGRLACLCLDTMNEYYV